MKGLFRVGALAAIAGLVGAAGACASLDESTGRGFVDGSDAGASPTGTNGADASLGGGEASDAPGVDKSPKGNGVVLLHAATYPAFRLCFSNFPQLQPQPDSTIMPEANVVGVEHGSVVRLPPTAAPGTVYVFIERYVRTAPGTTGRTCGQLLKATDLKLHSQYEAAGELTQPIGQDSVALLALTGCGSTSVVSQLGGRPEDCGDWDGGANLAFTNQPLVATTDVADTTHLQAQVGYFSRPIDTARADGGVLSVSFHGADGGAPLEMLPSPTLFALGNTVNLPVDQNDPQVYGNAHFEVSLGGTTLATQTLADIQALSSPEDVPSSYYNSASSYVMLLLGDPQAATVDGGAVDPRSAVHLLAVPVLVPERDAGADAGGSGAPAPDGGT